MLSFQVCVFLILAFQAGAQEFESGKILPGYGTKITRVGNILDNLQRLDLMVGIELPQWNETKLRPTARWITEEACNSKIIAEAPKSLLAGLCQQFTPLLTRFQIREAELLKEIHHKLSFELPALVPSLGQNDLEDIDFSTNVPNFNHMKGQNQHNLSDPIEAAEKEELEDLLEAFHSKLQHPEIKVELSQAQAVIEQRKQAGIDLPITYRKKRSTSSHETTPLFTFLERTYRDVKAANKYLRIGQRAIANTNGNSCYVWDANKRNFTVTEDECLQRCRFNMAPDSEVDFLVGQCFQRCRKMNESTDSEDDEDLPEQSTFNGTLRDYLDEFEEAITRNDTLPETMPVCIDPLTGDSLTRKENGSLDDAMKMARGAFEGSGRSSSEVEELTRIYSYLVNIPPEIKEVIDYPTVSKIDGCVHGSLLQANTHFVKLALECSTCIYQVCVNDYYRSKLEDHMSTLPRSTERLRNALRTIRRLDNPVICRQKCPSAIREAVAQWQTQAVNFWNEPPSRKKRETQKRSVGLALGVVSAVTSLVRDGLGIYMDIRKSREFHKAMTKVNNRLKEHEDKLEILTKEMLALTKVTKTQFTEVWTILKENQIQFEVLQHAFVKISEELINKTNANTEAIGFIAWMTGTVQSILQTHENVLLEFVSKIDDYLTGIDQLSSGTLTHQLVPPASLSCYLRDIQQELQLHYRHYELAMPEINKYYDTKMMQVAAEGSTLYVNIPVFLKQTNQDPSELYEVTTAPVPLNPDRLQPDPDTHQWKGDYSHIIVNEPFLAIDNQANGRLEAKSYTKRDLDKCFRFGNNHYCEESTVRFFSENHKCGLSLFLDDLPRIQENCEIKYLTDHDPTPTAFIEGKDVLLIAMPPPWTKRCAKGAFTADYTPAAVAVVPKQVLCHCDLHLGPFQLRQILTGCDADQQGDDGSPDMSHIVNTIGLYVFKKWLDPANIEQRNQQTILKEGDKLATLSGSLLLKEPSKVIIPSLQELQVIERNPESEMEREELSSLPFDEIIDALNRKQYIPTTEVNKHNIERNFLVLIIGICITGTMLIIAFFNCCRTCKNDKNSRQVQLLELQDHDNPAFHGVQSVAPSPISPYRLSTENRFRRSSHRRSGRANSLGRQMTWLTTMTIIALCAQPTNSVSLSEKEPKVMVIDWKIMDFMLFAACSLVAIILIILLTALLSWATTLRRNPLAHKRGCKNLLCRNWTDQCNVYIQISTFECYQCIRLYLGSILGPPIGIKLKGELQINQLGFLKGCLRDELRIEWGRVTFEYQGKRFHLPSVINIYNPKDRLLARHLLAKHKLSKICNIAIVHNDILLIRPLLSNSVMRATEQRAPPTAPAPNPGMTAHQPNETQAEMRMHPPPKLYAIDYSEDTKF